MRSLDTLIPLRAKAEAGRPPAGEEAHADGASGFEALLDAFENGTAPAGESAAGQAETAPDGLPGVAAETPVPVAAGSALQALMALAGQAPPSVAPLPDPGLDAMVQRAAARAGSGAEIAPTSPALAVSVVGLETHFAPVLRHGPAASATAHPGVGPKPGEAAVFPSPVGSGATPALPDGASMARLSPPRDSGDDASATPEAVPAGAEAGAPPSTRLGLSDPATEAGRPAPVRGHLAPSPQAASNPPSSPEAGTIQPLGLVLGGERPADPTGTPMRPVEPASALPSSTPSGLRPPAAPAVRPDAGLPPRAAETAQIAALAQGSPAAAADAAPLQAAILTAQDVADQGRVAGRSSRLGASDPTNQALPDDSASAGVAVPSAQPSSGATRPAERVPEPQRSHPFGSDGPGSVAARSTDSVPTPEADTRRLESEGRGTADRSIPEAPHPDAPRAEPVAQVVSAPAPAPSSPLRQIVDAVAAQMPPAPTGPARPGPAPGEVGPLRILTLQLKPAELGSVLVRMRLQDGRLEMNLRTSREETAERLRSESDLLSGLLREAGYEPEAVTIQAGGPGSGESASRSQSLASFAGSQGGQHDRQPGAATPDHSGRRPSARADEAVTAREEQEHETDTRGPDRGGLYL